MAEAWTVYVIVFLLVGVTALLLQSGLGEALVRRRQISKRFAEIVPAGPATEEVLRRRSSRLGRSTLALRLSRLIRQAGSVASPPRLVAIWLALVLGIFVALPFPDPIALRLLIAAGCAALLVTLWLRTKRAGRMARFGEQLPEVLDIIVRSLKAGHPLPVSLGLVAREMPEPAGPEFALVVDEVSYGRSITEALDNLYDRVGYPELKFFVASTSIAQQTGGNLGEILSRLSAMLRERFRLARRVRALSAEGRFSGLALSILPVALFGILNLMSPAYYADFWQSPSATLVLTISIVMLAIGNLVIYRLVHFRV